MTSSTNKNKGVVWSAMAITALSLALMFVNVWNEANTFRPVRTDEAHQLHTALHFAWHFGLEEVTGPEGGRQPYWSIDPKYPPLVNTLTGLLFLGTGYSRTAAIFVVALFIPLLLFSAWGVARRLKWPPLLCASFVAALLMCPQIWQMSREYMLDFPLTAMVMACAWALLSTEDFTRRRASVVLGVMLGLTMLTRWTAPQFLLPVLGWAALTGWKRREARWNMAIAASIALALMCLWYPQNIMRIFSTAVEHGLKTVGPQEGGRTFPSLLSIEAWFSNGQLLGLMLPGAVMLLAALAACLLAYRRERTSPLAWPLAWSIGCYLMVTILPPRDPRLLIPMLPVCCLLAVSCLKDRFFQGSWKREGVVAALLVASLFVWGKPCTLKPQVSPTTPGSSMPPSQGDATSGQGEVDVVCSKDLLEEGIDGVHLQTAMRKVDALESGRLLELLEPPHELI